MNQLSLLELDRLEVPGIPDEDHVARLAQTIVDELGLAPPIDHKVVASFQGIAEIRKAESDGWAGCLVKEARGLVVYVKASDGHRRQRYTTCHEVGHTFLPGFAIRTQFRCVPSRNGIRPQEERLSDVAASELLFPRRFFDADLHLAPFGLGTVRALADRYDASLEATAHRFVSRWPEDCLFVVLEPQLKPSEISSVEAAPRLRVSYSRHSGNWPYVPPFKSADGGSLLAAALEGEIVGTRSIGLDGLLPAFDEPVEISAELVPYRDAGGHQHRRVLALYRRASPSRPNGP